VSDLKTFWKCLKLLPYFARLARHPVPRNSRFFQRLDWVGAPASRPDYLLELSRGRRVLHFGFLDSPFTAERTQGNLLLHQRLRETASFLFGLDIDAGSLELYCHLTGDRDNAVLDIQQPLPPADFLANRYEVILFPEVLEHLLHPGAAMANLREICRRNPGSKLCITTPNAFSLLAFFTAVGGNELVHPDHYYYFSPMTLRKMVLDTGFKLDEMRLYAEPAHFITSPGITKHGLIALCAL